jgi:hypothetical protein
MALTSYGTERDDDVIQKQCLLRDIAVSQTSLTCEHTLEVEEGDLNCSGEF